MHVASIYVLIPVQNIAEIIAGLYFALYSAAVFCTGMSTSYVCVGVRDEEKRCKEMRDASPSLQSFCRYILFFENLHNTKLPTKYSTLVYHHA
jgi:hypothetical protein